MGKFTEFSVLLAVKDDLKQANQGQKVQSPQGANSALGKQPQPGLPVDKTQIKNALQICTEIIRKCFNNSAPKSVQKLGLFKL